jgi:hypothetical protein
MVRTRYVALAFAVTAATAPLIVASPVSAAPSELTFSGSTLYTGTSPVITFDDQNEEAGAFTLDLFKGETKVATITSGDDVSALSTFKWTIPTGVKKLVDSGLTLHLSSTDEEPAFETVESAEFAIATSTIGSIQLQDPGEEEDDDPVVVTSAAAGSTHTLVWEKLGATGSKVKVDLVQKINGKDKKIPLLKETANDGSEPVTIPTSAVANTTTRIEITPSNKAATPGKSEDFEVTGVSAPTVKVVAAGDEAGDSALTTAKNGDTVNVTWTGSAPVQLDLYAEGATKPAAKITKSAKDGSFEYVIPAKLAAGKYTVKATVVGVKPAVTADSGEITIAQPTYTVGELAGPWTQGETVTISWTSDGSSAGSTSSVTVALVNGTKVTKIDAKGVTENGAGSVEWVVPAKQAPGTTYKVRVINNNVKQAEGTFADSADLTIQANSTKLS